MLLKGQTMFRKFADVIGEWYRERYWTTICDECGKATKYNRLAYPYCLACAVDMSGEEDTTLYAEGGFYD